MVYIIVIAAANSQILAMSSSISKVYGISDEFFYEKMYFRTRTIFMKGKKFKEPQHFFLICTCDENSLGIHSTALTDSACPFGLKEAVRTTKRSF